ncbi:MAG: dehydratase [Candidatus Abyssobacteria bacterium SURF_5]|uniref:Dehydratase n=1 Tax=Abyssobacteria bacterium (strain SURF_5) TaxID=2093360 RepID=A0A3A4N8A2_ABYX5|nr:MAG: dehydratase [Candidatus Abyssubacteria bacterium SURF_5]
MFNKYFDDIAIGDKVVSRGRTVTEADLVNFSMFSADWFPLHSDVEYARATMFGGRIAHGLLVLSIASGLVPLQPYFTIAFYGMDRVRFINATRIGDTIHVEGEVIEKEERNDQSGIITYRQTVKNQRGEDVVVGIMKVLMARAKRK